MLRIMMIGDWESLGQLTNPGVPHPLCLFSEDASELSSSGFFPIFWHLSLFLLTYLESGG